MAEQQTQAAQPGHTPEVDEVLRRIGRNLLLFQHMEHLLKHLLSKARIEGTAGTARAKQEKRQASLHKQTMGALANQFAGDVLSNADDPESPVRVGEAGFSFRFGIQADSSFVEQHSAEMKAIVEARNNLIHHFLPRWLPASEESTREALAYLDEQRAQALPMRDRLQGIARSLDAAEKDLAAFLASPEGERQFELQWLRQSRLVLLLGELAGKTSRADGWMDLGTAGQVIKHLEPDELEGLVERFGHRTLKKLLLATELFDVGDEPTSKGGTRTIYRINPHCALRLQ